MSYTTLEEALVRAEELFKAEVAENPAPGVEVSVDWTESPFNEAFNLAMRGDLYSIEDELYQNCEFYDSDMYWEGERLDSVKAILADEIDLDADFDEDDVITALRDKIRDGDVETESCYPEIDSNIELPICLTYHDGSDNEVSGIVALFRDLGIHFTQVMDLMPQSSAAFTNYLINKSTPEDFSEALRPIGPHDLQFLSDSNAADCKIGIILPMRWHQLEEINKLVMEGGKFDLSIKNPALFSYDGWDASSYESNGAIVHKEVEHTLTLNSDRLKALAEACSCPVERNTESRLLKCGVTCVNEPQTQENLSADDALSVPELNVANFKRDAVIAILQEDPEELDRVIDVHADKVPMFKPLMYSEMIGGWSLMHFAALKEYKEEAADMLRKLQAEGVMSSMEAVSMQHHIADWYLGDDWREELASGFNPPSVPEDEDLELLVEIGATRISKGELKDQLPEDKQLLLIALENEHKLQSESKQMKKMSRRL